MKAKRCLIAVVTLACCSWGCETAGFKRAYMALDSAGDRKRERFFTDTEQIFCVGELASGRADLTVTAKLVAHELGSTDGSAAAGDVTLATEELAPGKGEDLRVSFEWEKSDKKDPYPVGRFDCELHLDGELAELLPFQVDYPACPVPPPFDGTVCAPYFLEGATCPGAVSDTTCACDESGAWSCE